MLTPQRRSPVRMPETPQLRSPTRVSPFTTPEQKVNLIILAIEIERLHRILLSKKNYYESKMQDLKDKIYQLNDDIAAKDKAINDLQSQIHDKNHQMGKLFSTRMQPQLENQLANQLQLLNQELKAAKAQISQLSMENKMLIQDKQEAPLLKRKLYEMDQMYGNLLEEKNREIQSLRAQSPPSLPNQQIHIMNQILQSREQEYMNFQHSPDQVDLTYQNQKLKAEIKFLNDKLNVLLYQQPKYSSPEHRNIDYSSSFIDVQVIHKPHSVHSRDSHKSSARYLTPQQPRRTPNENFREFNDLLQRLHNLQNNQPPTRPNIEQQIKLIGTLLHLKKLELPPGGQVTHRFTYNPLLNGSQGSSAEPKMIFESPRQDRNTVPTQNQSVPQQDQRTTEQPRYFPAQEVPSEAENSRQTENLQKVEDLNQALQQAQNDLQTKTKELNNQIRTLQQVNEELQQKIVELNQTNQQLDQAWKKKLQDNFAQAYHQLSQVEQQVKSKNDQYEADQKRLTDNIAKLTKENARLQLALQEKPSSDDNRSQSLQQSSDEQIAQLNERLTQSKQRADQLQNLLQLQQQQVKDEQSKNINLNGAYEQLKLKFDQLAIEKVQLQKTISSLQQQLKSMQNDSASKSKVAELERKLDQLQEQLEQQQQQFCEERQQFRDLQQQSQQQQNLLKQQQMIINKQNNQSEQDRKQLQSQEKQIQEYEEMLKQQDSLRQKEPLQEQLRSLEQQLKRAQDENDELRNQVELQTDQINDLQVENSQLQQTNQLQGDPLKVGRKASEGNLEQRPDEQQSSEDSPKDAKLQQIVNKLVGDIERRDDEIKKLQMGNDALKRQADQLQLLNNRLQMDLRNQQQSLNQLQSKFDAKTQRESEQDFEDKNLRPNESQDGERVAQEKLQQQIVSKLVGEIEKKDSEIDQLRQKLNQMEQQQQLQQAGLSQQQRKKNEEDPALESGSIIPEEELAQSKLSQIVAKLVGDIEGRDKALRRLELECTQAEDEKQYLQEQINKLLVEKGQVAARMKSQEKAFNDQQKALEDQIKKLNEEIEKLKSKLDIAQKSQKPAVPPAPAKSDDSKLQQTIAQLQKEIENKDGTINDLQNQVKENQQKAEQERNMQKQQIDTLRRSERNLKADFQKLEKQLTTQQQDFESQKQRLQAELAQAQQDLQALKGQTTQPQAQQQTQGQLPSPPSRNPTDQQQVVQLKQEKLRLQQQINDLNRKVVETENRWEAKTLALSDEVAQLNMQLLTRQKQIDQMKADLDKKNNELSSLKNSGSAGTPTKSKDSSDALGLKQRIEFLERQLAEINEDNRAKMRQKVMENQQLNSQIKELNHKCHSLQVDVDTLEEENKKLKQENRYSGFQDNSSYQLQIQSLQDQNRKLMAMIDTKDREIMMIRENSGSSREIIHIREERISSSQTVNQDSQETLFRLKEQQLEIGELLQRLEAKEDIIQRLQEKDRKAQETIAQLTKELQALKSKADLQRVQPQDLSNQLVEKDRKIQALQAQLEEVSEHTRLQMQQALNKLVDEIQEQDRQIKNQSLNPPTSVDLSASNKALQEKVLNQQALIERLQQQLEADESRHQAELQRAVKKLVDELMEKDQQLQAFRQESLFSGQLQQQLQQLQTQNESLQSQLESVTQPNDDANKETVEFAKHQQVIQKLVRDLEGVEYENQRLRQQLDQELQSSCLLQESLKQAQDQNQLLESQLREDSRPQVQDEQPLLNPVIHKLLQDIEEADRKFADLKQLLEQQIALNKAQQLESQQQIGLLNDQLSKAQKALEVQKQLNSNLQAQANDQEKQIRDFILQQEQANKQNENEKRRLQEENAKLKHAIIDLQNSQSQQDKSIDLYRLQCDIDRQEAAMKQQANQLYDAKQRLAKSEELNAALNNEKTELNKRLQKLEMDFLLQEKSKEGEIAYLQSEIQQLQTSLEKTQEAELQAKNEVNDLQLQLAKAQLQTPPKEKSPDQELSPLFRDLEEQLRQANERLLKSQREFAEQKRQFEKQNDMLQKQLASQLEQLQIVKSESEQIIKGLQIDVQRLTEENKKLKQRADEQNALQQDYQSKIMALQDLEQQIQLERMAKSNLALTQQQEIKNYKAEIDQLNSELQQLRNNSYDESQKLKLQIRSLESQLRQLNLDKQELIIKNETNQKMAEAKIMSLQQELDLLRNQSISYQEVLSDRLKNEVEQLRRENYDLQSQVEELKFQVEEMPKDKFTIEQLKLDNENKFKLLTNFEVEKQQLKQQLNQLKSQLENTDMRQGEWKNQYLQLNETLQSYQKQNSKYEQIVLQKDKEINELKMQLLDAQNAQGKKDAEIRSLKDQLSQSNLSVSILQTKNGQLDQAANDLQSRLSTLEEAAQNSARTQESLTQTQLQVLKKLVQDKMAETDDISRQLEVSRQANDELADQLNQLQSALDDMQSQLAQLNLHEQQSSLESQIKELQKEKQDLNQHSTYIDEVNTELTKEIEQLKSKLSHLQTEKEEQELQIQLNAKKQALQEKSQRRKIQALDEELKQARNEDQNLAIKYNEYAIENQQLKQQLNQWVQKYNDLYYNQQNPDPASEVQIMRLNDQIAILYQQKQQQAIEHKHKIEVMEEDHDFKIRQYQEKISELEGKLSYDPTNKKILQENELLAAEVARLSDQLGLLRNQLDSRVNIDDQTTQLQGKLSKLEQQLDAEKRRVAELQRLLEESRRGQDEYRKIHQGQAQSYEDQIAQLKQMLNANDESYKASQSLIDNLNNQNRKLGESNVELQRQLNRMSEELSSVSKQIRLPEPQLVEKEVIYVKEESEEVEHLRSELKACYVEINNLDEELKRTKSVLSRSRQNHTSPYQLSRNYEYITLFQPQSSRLVYKTPQCTQRTFEFSDSKSKDTEEQLTKQVEGWKKKYEKLLQESYRAYPKKDESYEIMQSTVKLTEEVKFWQTKYEDLQASQKTNIAPLEGQILNLRTENLQLQGQMQDLERQYEDRIRQLTEENEKGFEIRLKQEEFEFKNSQLQQEINKMQQQLSKATSSNKEIMEDNHKLKLNLQNLLKQSATLEEKDKYLAEILAELKTTKAQNENLRLQINDLRDFNNKLQLDLKSAQQQIEGLKYKLTQSDVEVNQLMQQQRIFEEQESNITIVRQYKYENETLREKLKETDDLRRELQLKDLEIRRLQTEIQINVNKTTSLETHLKSPRGSLVGGATNRLESQLLLSQQKETKLREEAEYWQGNFEQVQNQVRIKDQEIFKQNRLIEELYQKLDSKSEPINVRSSKQLELQRDELRLLREKVDQLNAQIALKEKENNLLSRQIEQLSQEREEILSMLRQSNLISQQKSEANHRASPARNSVQLQEKMLRDQQLRQQQIEELRRELEILKRQQLRTSGAEFSAERLSYEAQLTSLQKQLQFARVQIEELQLQQQNNPQVQQLTKENAELRSQIQYFKELNVKLQQHIATKSPQPDLSKLDELNVELRDKIKELQQLKQQYRQALATIHELEERCITRIESESQII